MILLTFLLFIHFARCERFTRTIRTNSGPVRGIALDGKNVDAFLGIPFAEPPVGNLRFARPVPKTPWKETFTADELPRACVQYTSENISMNEDCLYLNLWVPHDGTPLKPVMVFIYGGGFLGSSSGKPKFNGATLSQHGKVIVASMNYRVGTLGFFYGYIEEAAGNMGMYDQLLAFQWIKENARHFGGDPHSMLIFGQSSGASCVALHMISPLSKRYFKRAIVESGGIIHPAFSNDNKALRAGSALSSMRLGCASNNEELTENPKGVIECMKKLPPEKFVKADSIFWDNYITGELVWMIPRVGDALLPESPSDLFQKGKTKNTEVIIGLTRDEGSILVSFQPSFLTNITNGKPLNPSIFNETIAKEVLQFYTKNEKSNKIVQNYFKRVEEDSNYTYFDAVRDITGDALIACGTVFHADFQSLKSHPVYFYRFDYRSPVSAYPEWIGVPHGAEVPYVFGNLQIQNFTTYDEELSTKMMDMWVAFAKTGNPNLPRGLKWPKYTHNNPKYLLINEKFKVGLRPDNYRCDQWRELYGAIIRDGGRI